MAAAQVMAWRARVLTDERRACMSRWALRIGLAAMVVGFLVSTTDGQSQDSINATLIARMDANYAHDAVVDRRLDDIDQKLWYGLVGIVSILVTNLLQLGSKKGTR